MDVVRAHGPLRIPCPDRGKGLMSNRADLDASLVHALPDEADEFPSALLGQGRDIESDGGAIDGRREPDPALADRRSN